MNGIVALNKAKSYVNEVLVGGGSLVGKNVIISSITPIEHGNRVTFSYTLDNGETKESYLDVMNGVDGKEGDTGVGISSIQKINSIDLVDTYEITFSNNTTFKYNVTNGQKGDTGLKGDKGDKGEQGIQGIQGEKGNDGYPFLIYKEYSNISEFNENDFPEIGLMFMIKETDATSFPVYRYTGVSEMPYSHITNLNEGEAIKGDKGEKGDTGEQGIQGEAGKNGKTYTPTIGSVAEGGIPSVSILIDEEKETATFDFTLVSGKDGKTYIPKIGDVISVENSENANVNIDIDENNNIVTFNFKIPKGERGNTGEVGQEGITPIIVGNEYNDENTYRLDIMTNGELFTTPNLKGASSDVALDTIMSDTSENPVQNRVIKEYIDNKSTSNVQISSEIGNVIQLKADGIYVSSCENNDILENLSEDADGNLLYKGIYVNQTKIDVLTEQNNLLKEEISELENILISLNNGELGE